MTAAETAAVAASRAEILINPHFAEPDSAGLPAHWRAMAPVWSAAACRLDATGDDLIMEGGSAYAVGGVAQIVEGIAGGQAYAIEAECLLQDIGHPLQSALVRLHWTRAGRVLHPGGWLAPGQVEGDLMRFADVQVAPAQADGAQVQLECKWPRGGRLHWRRASMRRTEPPSARPVKVGTVYLMPKNSTPQRNLALCAEQIEKAGELGLDIVCLGESVELVGTGVNVAQVARAIPGPETELLGQAVRRAGVWTVIGLLESAGDTLYNTAVLFDRQGRIAGRYRKVHLPREEWRQGITPGDEYPLFETDFGTIAIQICYDWFFPEPHALWGLQGAEIILAPTWGNTLPDVDGRVDGESTFRVRARDNGVYLVPSVYSGDSMVIDPLGQVLARSGGEQGLFWCQIDLAQRERLPWVGHWRAIGVRDRMPDTYTGLLGAASGPR
ncbi:MAG: hypothetical protein GKR89_07600 [Candidatus Latescibacteria bacterium]|nr:hypothetical protein [Candidatus Latescibacterota bacterium]